MITCHIEADFDALASILAAHKLYPGAVVVFPGAQESALRTFAAEGRVPELPVMALRELDRDAVRRLIVVDTRRADRIGALGEVATRRDVELHVYDHHPPNPGDLRGAVDVSRPVGANTTLLLRCLAERHLPIAPEEATLYLLGLYQETGCLTYAGTTPEDCEAAARLLRVGGSLEVVARFLPGQMDAAQVAVLDDLLRSASELDVHGARVVVAQAASEAYVAGLGETASRAMGIRHARAFFGVVRMEDRIFVVGRSRDPAVDCGAILSRLGGGGHAAAAAASVKGATLVEVREALIGALRACIVPAARARDRMTAPAETIAPGERIARAAKQIERAAVDVLPVVEDAVPVGLISRQTIERALHHGLSQATVAEYMTTDFTVLDPDALIEAVAQVLIEQHQRLVPIVDRGALVGVVTRANLLDLSLEGDETAALLPSYDEPGKGAEDTAPARTRGLRKLLEERLPAPLVDLLRDLGRTAAERGMHAYVVGGFVRDLLLNEEDFDLDVVVEGDGIKFAEAFTARTGGRVLRHEMFGTATIALGPEAPGAGRSPTRRAWNRIDVATARHEHYARPGALPTVERSSLRRDLNRRDFTINALAVRLDPEGFGELLDFFGGQRDLKERRIRVLHALSFVEDPTRAFRGLRFEGRFRFRADRFTERLMRAAPRHLDTISGPRICNELVQILQEPRVCEILHRLSEVGLLQALDPALAWSDASARRIDRVAEARTWFGLLYTDEAIVAWIPAWLAFTEKMSAEEAARLEKRLGIVGWMAKRITASRQGAREALRDLSPLAHGAHLAPSKIAAALRPLPVEGLLWLMATAVTEPERRAISRYLTQWRRVAPALGGDDVMALGVPEGPAVGAALTDLLDARLDGVVSTSEEEEERVRARLAPHAAH